MSFLLPHLNNGYAVDQAILGEEDRVVIIRWGHDHDPICMQMDEVLANTSEQMKNFAIIYLVDISKVPVSVKAGSGGYMNERLALGRSEEKWGTLFIHTFSPLQHVQDFTTMYELYDPCTVMFFFRNKHIMIDLGTGNNNKINWAFTDKQEFIDIV